MRSFSQWSRVQNLAQSGQYKPLKSEDNIKSHLNGTSTVYKFVRLFMVAPQQHKGSY